MDEGLAAGADPIRVHALATQWQCDDKDAAIFADRVGCDLHRDGNAWCATDRHFVNLQESPAGFGATALEAMAELCKEIGYRPSKMWGTTFVDLLNRKENTHFGVGA